MERQPTRCGAGSPQKCAGGCTTLPPLSTRCAGSPMSRRKATLPRAESSGGSVGGVCHPSADVVSRMGTVGTAVAWTNPMLSATQHQRAGEVGVAGSTTATPGGLAHPEADTSHSADTVAPPDVPRRQRSSIYSVPAFLRNPVVTSVSVFTEDDAGGEDKDEDGHNDGNDRAPAAASLTRRGRYESTVFSHSQLPPFSFSITPHSPREAGQVNDTAEVRLGRPSIVNFVPVQLTMGDRPAPDVSVMSKTIRDGVRTHGSLTDEPVVGGGIETLAFHAWGLSRRRTTWSSTVTLGATTPPPPTSPQSFHQQQQQQQQPFTLARLRRHTAELQLSCLSAHRNFIDPALTLLHTFLLAVGREVVTLALRRTAGAQGGDYDTNDHSAFDASYDSSGAVGQLVLPTARLSHTTVSSGAAQTNELHDEGTPSRLSAHYITTSRAATPQSTSVACSVSVIAPIVGGGAHAMASVLVRHPTSAHSGEGGEREDTSDAHRSAYASGGGAAAVTSPSLPYYTRNHGFCYDEAVWFSRDGLSRLGRRGYGASVLLAVTAEPPLFISGMLLDPVSERFLFNGVAFREEARVLRVIPHGAPPGARQAKMLLREYFTTHQPDLGYLLQTFSLLSDEAKVMPHKQQLLTGDVVRTLMFDTLAGAVTRVFALRDVTAGGLATASGAVTPMAAPVMATVSRTSRTAVAEGAETTVPRATTSAQLRPVPRVLPAGGLEGCMRGLVQHATVYGVRGPVRSRPSSGTSSHRGVAVNAMPNGFSVDVATCSRHGGGDHGVGALVTRWASEQDVAQLAQPTDTVRVFMQWYIHRQQLVYVLHAWVVAVRRLQRFLRGCLQRKRRALQRMLRLWRQLEIDARQRLQHYRAPASTMERVDTIAGNLLQQHMVTTREYKVRLIEELWAERRAAYRNWRAEPHALECTTSAYLLARTHREEEEMHEYFGWYIDPAQLLYESHHRLLDSLKTSVLTMEAVEMKLQRVTQGGLTGRGRRQDRVAVQSASSGGSRIPPSDHTSPRGPFTPQSRLLLRE